MAGDSTKPEFFALWSLRQLQDECARLNKVLKECSEIASTPELKLTQIGDLEWSENLGDMTWQKAMDIAKELGARVPTRLELLDLYDNHYEECQKLIKDSPSGNFWSATEYSSTSAWSVSLIGGNTSYCYKTGTYQLRCVR